MTVFALAHKAPPSPELTERFVDAVRLANELHDGARRPGTEIPVLAHLLIVTGLVLEAGGDETAAVAALLHDAVEECGDEALERIHDEFGAQVAAIVAECSDEGSHGKQTWRQRERAHLRHMARVHDERVMPILLADKVHNVRSIVRDYRSEGDALWRRYPDRTVDDQIWYFRGLVALFERFCDGPLVLDLRRGVAELEELVLRH